MKWIRCTVAAIVAGFVCLNAWNGRFLCVSHNALSRNKCSSKQKYKIKWIIWEWGKSVCERAAAESNRNSLPLLRRRRRLVRMLWEKYKYRKLRISLFITHQKRNGAIYFSFLRQLTDSFSIADVPCFITISLARQSSGRNEIGCVFNLSCRWLAAGRWEENGAILLFVEMILGGSEVSRNRKKFWNDIRVTDSFIIFVVHFD